MQGYDRKVQFARDFGEYMKANKISGHEKVMAFAERLDTIRKSTQLLKKKSGTSKSKPASTSVYGKESRPIRKKS